MTACHVPSPGRAGRSCDERSAGFAGIVVVVVVVVASGTVVVVVDVVEVDVVVVDVVVEVTTVATVLSMGQDEVATVGRICSGVMRSGTDVVVDDWPGEGFNVVEV
jgi:cobalamin biosynthesis protein CobD/CbiB